MKLNFWTPTEILRRNCDYNIVFGERGNGKSYGVQDYALQRFCKEGKQLAVIRRWDEDLRGKRGATYFDNIVNDGLVKKYTKDKYQNISYMSRSWYLSTYDEKIDKMVKDEVPFAYAFSLSAMEHDKSTAYPNVDTIVFEEFITRDIYRPNEFIEFMNTLSTIIRHRTGVKIFMLGNTVNQYCPYFAEMGLKNITKMNIGDIDVYEDKESGLKIAVEYARGLTSKGKPSDKYFAFDNPKLHMITRGAWEIASYPHLMISYDKNDILFTYFILFKENLLQCEIIQKDDDIFTYIHRKTTPIKNPDEDLIFTTDIVHKNNYRRRVTDRYDEIGTKISYFYKTEKLFYQDNEVGEIVRNYLLWCRSSSITNV